MYKAGDFTNGKMNEIFKSASNSVIANKYDNGDPRYGVGITHKQLGEFVLVNSELLAIKSACLYCIIAGISLQDFYKDHGDGSIEADERQLNSVNFLLFPCSDTVHDRVSWGDAYFMLSDRLMVIMERSIGDDCEKYMELISNAK